MSTITSKVERKLCKTLKQRNSPDTYPLAAAELKVQTFMSVTHDPEEEPTPASAMRVRPNVRWSFLDELETT